jgi:hypothetical protein
LGAFSLKNDKSAVEDFRARAQEARSVADAAEDEKVKRELLILAEMWERLAKRETEREK